MTLQQIQQQIYYLQLRLERIQKSICCTPPGLTSVTTEDSATVTFSGTGTADDPLTATVSGEAAGANPTASLGLTAINGVATTYMRSDAAPALSQSIAPTWTQPHHWATPTGLGGEFIRSAHNNSNIAFYDNTNTTRSGYIQIRNTDGSVGTSLATPFSIFTNGTTRMTVAANGQVGIGVAPVGMLHIGQGTSAMTSPAGDQGIVLTNNQAYGNRLYFENLLSTSGQRMTMIGNYSNQMVFSSLNDTATAFVHEGIIRLNAGAGTVMMKSMIGTGTRAVVTAADGTLSSQAIPLVFEGAALPGDLTPYPEGSLFIIT